MKCGFQSSLKTYENELDELHIRRDGPNFKQNARSGKSKLAKAAYTRRKRR